MNKHQQEQRIQSLVNKIASQFNPEKIILFGSHAWGDPSPTSDVDLFIIKDTTQHRLERGREVERIIMGSGLPVDALVYTPSEIDNRLALADRFVQKVLTSGKIIYDRTTNTVR